MLLKLYWAVANNSIQHVWNFLLCDRHQTRWWGNRGGLDIIPALKFVLARTQRRSAEKSFGISMVDSVYPLFLDYEPFEIPKEIVDLLVKHTNTPLYIVISVPVQEIPKVSTSV